MALIQLADFEANIRRRGLHLRSSDLNHLVTAVATFNTTPNPANLQSVYRLFTQWKRRDPKEFDNRGRPIEQDFYRLIAEAAENLGVAFATIVPEAMTPRQLVNKHKWALNRMKGFASGDCTQFPGNMNQLKRPQIEARFHQAIAEGRKMGGSGAASIGVGALFGSTAWNANKLRRTYYTVYENKAGVCTSFAEAAAHLLTDGLDVANAHVPRVEVMSFKNHVFVVVGRNNNSTPPPHFSQWGDHWYLVDPWAGAMGYEVIYEQTNGFPETFLGMINPVKLVMGSR